ncbi:MAG TPA: hypothetical protein VG478_15735 [Acidimicrobiales bacterium]|nr:hypothetical protein [Acidimicrobiales bacterium]
MGDSVSASSSKRLRRLAAALEPVVGQVYFSPECHAAYTELGFSPSPGVRSGVALPDGPAYFTSRGSLMGQVHGTVIAAAFAVFNPAVVVPAVAYGWTLTDATTIRAVRQQGAVAQLRRILGPAPDGAERAAELLGRAVDVLRPEGKPLFAGALAQPVPDEGPLGAVWRFGDCLREYRGDVHTISWVGAGFDAVEMGLLTELYWGLPLRTYIRTRAWSDEQLDAALERLVARGLVDADGAFTPQGRMRREAIEADTDRRAEPIATALGDEIEDVCAVLEPWGAAIRTAGGYFTSGPHELARLRGLTPQPVSGQVRSSHGRSRQLPRSVTRTVVWSAGDGADRCWA